MSRRLSEQSARSEIGPARPFKARRAEEHDHGNTDTTTARRRSSIGSVIVLRQRLELDEASSSEDSEHDNHSNNGVRATVNDDSILVVSGLDRTPRKSTKTNKHEVPGQRHLNGQLERSGDLPEQSHYDNNVPAEPNERGLYSKAYVQRHPEIQWTHRGQGLYRHDGELAKSQKAQSPRKRAADAASSPQDQQSSRSSKRQRSSDIRDNSPPQWSVSPLTTHNPDSAPGYGLRQRHVAYQPNASERREARLRRRATPRMPGVDVDEYDDDDEDESEGEEDSEEYDDEDEDRDTAIGQVSNSKTYSKAYVDAHPELDFKHCGNGFYRRAAPTNTANQPSRSSRRSSQHSLNFAEQTASVDRSLTVIHEMLSDGTSTKSSSQPKNGFHDASQEESRPSSSNSSAVIAGEDATAAQSFSKAEMLAYKDQHPEANFMHRGNGRYKRVGQKPIEMKPQVEKPTDRVTYGKSYVESHPEMAFYHCGAGRYKRVQQPPTLGRANSNRQAQASFDESERGNAQERERADRRRLLNNSQEITSPASAPSLKSEKESLFDKDYVDNHPDETFHHRGQGRWAKGLPPPGSSSKMAVRGPGIKLIKTMSNSSVETQREPMPRHGELFRKDEGPQKWPDLDWTYRGGGKWVLSTKQVASNPRAKRAAQPGRYVEPALEPDQSELESNASTSRRGSVNGLDFGRPRMKRTRSALQSIEDDEGGPIIVRSPKASLDRMLTLEEDTLTDIDLPDLFLEKWPQIEPDDTDDEAEHITRARHRPLNDPDLFIKSMTKHDPAIRPTETLYRLAEHMQQALSLMQDEYLELDKITAPHARIPRRVATGGRVPTDPLIYEDRKEADLYNYTFDPKKIGYQDPVAQQIVVDVDGRGLRKRRKRREVDTDAGAQLSEEIPLGRRITKPVQRFEANPAPQSRRPRSVLGRGSATPDPVVTPEKRSAYDADSYNAPPSGRWANHIPKRIRELRGGSAGPGRSQDGAGDGDRLEGEDESMLSESPRKRGPRSLLGGDSFHVSASYGAAELDTAMNLG